MPSLSRVKVVLWKELLDLSRDYKTLAYVILLPLLALPGLAVFAGGLYSAQTATVYIVDMDATDVSRGFSEGLAGYIRDSISGVELEVSVVEGGIGDAGVTAIIIIIPEGFGDSVSSLDGRASIRFVSLPGSPLSDQVFSATSMYLSAYERAVVESRVEGLARAADIDVDVDGFLDPLSLSREYRVIGGGVGGERAEAIAFGARIIAFSLFFMVNPAIVFVSDSIVGERERKTLEKLLLTRASRMEILAGKMLASSVLGIAAAAADSVALVAFFAISGYGFTVSALLALVWAFSALLLVLLTAGITAVISVRSETIRAAQSGSFLVLMVALAIYFASLAVDFNALPRGVSLALQAIPFTHASLAVFSAAYGDVYGVARHMVVLVLFTAGFLALAARWFRSERIIMFR